jgi:hypothetical protein
LPEVYSYLDSFAAKLNINAMSHRNVLCIQNDQRLLLHLNGHVS